MALLQVNFSPRALPEADGYDLNQVETPGGHGWDFWDAQIRRVPGWLPLPPAPGGPLPRRDRA